VETLELLSNPKAVKYLKQGLKEAKAGKLHSFKDVFGEDQ
jgi:PHD/YefM family antitoxin component YafN of YafNO toxin-antitoxin module